MEDKNKNNDLVMDAIPDLRPWGKPTRISIINVTEMGPAAHFNVNLDTTEVSNDSPR